MFRISKNPDHHKVEEITVESTGVKADIGDDWRESFVEAVKTSGILSVMTFDHVLLILQFGMKYIDYHAFSQRT